MSTSYLPVSDADRVVWLNTFSSRIGQYASSLGLTAGEVTGVQNDASMFAYVVQLTEAGHQYWSAIAGLKKSLRSSPQQSTAPVLPSSPSAGTPPAAVRSGIFNRIVLLVARIKQNSVYTTTMGQDLNIIPPVVTVNPNDLLPDLTIRLQSGHPLLKWKKGEADGVQLYVDRRDNAGFVPLAKVFRNNYLDIAEVPVNAFIATWDYKARYLVGDDEVGQFSQVISIQVIRTA